MSEPATKILAWMLIATLFLLILALNDVIGDDRSGRITFNLQEEIGDIVPSEETLETIVVERDQLPDAAAPHSPIYTHGPRARRATACEMVECTPEQKRADEAAYRRALQEAR